MIDEVMYGMMPSAKIVRRRKLPPLKRSKMPSTEPADWVKSCSRTAVLIPGVGMCAPIRYTAKRASVNSTRFRKSSMRNMFFTASMNRFMPVSCESSVCYNLERTTRLGNFFFGRRAKRLRVNRQLGRQLAIAQNFDGVSGAAHKTVRPEQLRSYRFAGRKNIQFRQVYNFVRHAKGVVKTALRHAPVQRHLSAFKAAAARIAAPRLPPLVDHAAHRRRILALHHLMHSPQAEAADGLTHVIGTADEADHPLDLHRATGFLAVVLGPVVRLDGSFCAGHFFPAH